LRFDQRFQVVFEDFGEIILQFRSPEVFENFLPVRGVLKESFSATSPGKAGWWFTDIVTTKVGLQFPGKDFQRCALANTVSSDKTEDLAWPWCW
jgi:hypothetical protein